MDENLGMPKQYIESGNYIVSKPANLVLEACLGTCVGVTLCDKTAKIGGLYHILLSEPTDAAIPWQPSYYASSGLPAFIDAVCNEGANRHRLEACIAGGALLGPLSRRDMDLDIGGRTAGVVAKILQKQAIPVTASETGGFLGCNLILNLKSFNTSIEPVGSPGDIEVDFAKPSADDIDNAIKTVQPIPQIALKIIRMIHNKDYDMPEVAREVENDQIISARVISLCNSAIIGVKNKIDSINRAIILLGEKHLFQLVLSAAIEPFFPEGKQGYSLCKGGLFYHSLKTALVAESLARATEKANPDVAYTAGLLHDIGKAAIDQYIDKAYPLFYRIMQKKSQELISAEQEVMGTTHADVGRQLAQMWSIPETLIDPISFHHEPHKATTAPDLTYLIYLTDLIMSCFQAGLELDCLNHSHLPECLQKTGISSDKLPLIIDLVPRNIFVQARLF